jgi:hypothetical protein
VEKGEKKTRRVFERPDYLASAWWKMLEAGDCKIEGHRENKKFRRRFGVTFKRFKEIVEDAKDWPIVVGEGEKTYGDIRESASGTPAVPLVLKILGWLRLNAKGEGRASCWWPSFYKYVLITSLPSFFLAPSSLSLHTQGARSMRSLSSLGCICLRCKLSTTQLGSGLWRTTKMSGSSTPARKPNLRTRCTLTVS